MKKYRQYLAGFGWRGVGDWKSTGGSDKGRENEKGSERGMDIVKRIVKK